MDCGHQPAPRDDDKPYSAQKRKPAVSAAEKQAKTEREADAKLQCEEDNRSRADLVAQEVSAESARIAVDIARSSYWLAFLNFLALVITLGAAFWAAHESRKSANAAIAQARAWVSVGPNASLRTYFRVEAVEDEDEIVVLFPTKWRNVGNSPALHFLQRSEFIVSGEKADILKAYNRMKKENLAFGHVVFPSDQFTEGKIKLGIHESIFPRVGNEVVGVIVICGVYKESDIGAIRVTPLLLTACIANTLSGVLIYFDIHTITGVTAT